MSHRMVPLLDIILCRHILTGDRNVIHDVNLRQIYEGSAIHAANMELVNHHRRVDDFFKICPLHMLADKYDITALR